MADITKISAYIYTADVSAAGTDGPVFLGIAGREFRLSHGNGFSQDEKFTFVLGDGANVENSGYNDPRKPQLDTDDLDRYPVYIRMEESGSGPAWCLEWARVTVNPDAETQHMFANPRLKGLGEESRIWLYTGGGKRVDLKRYDD